MIVLHVEPGSVLSWDDFKATKPTHSIALDGYVHAPPTFSARGPYLNLDHHAGVRRLATRSTCAQVYLALTLGLFETFQKDGSPHAHVYVNDADQDVCLSYWLLTHPEEIVNLNVLHPVARLLLLVDFVDATAGAYPIDPQRPIMQQQAWVFEPYTDVRRQGRMSEAEMRGVILHVSERISQFVQFASLAIDLDTRYDDLGGGPGWRLIAEIGMYARTKLYAEGVGAFVALRGVQDSIYTYVVGKMSPFVHFPVQRILRRLNEAEGISDPNDAWGGTEIIGGSPRKSGSRLPPGAIQSIVNECLGDSERGVE